MNDQLITVIQNDLGFELKFSLVDANGTAVDLSGATLKFSCQSLSDPTVQFKNDMIVISAVAGTCKYVASATDFLVAGQYSAQIIVTYMGGEVISFGGLTLQVNPRLPTDPTL